MDELKALIEEQGKAWKAYRDANDLRLAALEKGQGTAEHDSKLAKIEADLQATAKAIEDCRARMDKQNLNGSSAEAKDMAEINDWARAVKKGDKEFKSALTTQFDPGAGFVLAPEFEKNIDRIASRNGVLRSLATVTPIGGQMFRELKSKGGATGAWADELDTIVETTAPNMARIEIEAFKLAAMPLVSEEMLEDSMFDIAAWLAEEVGITFGEMESDAFINGTGVNQPFGILSYPTVANASYAWGKVGYIASGAAGAFAASTPADQLLDLIHALKAKYRQNGTFLMADATLAAVRKFKDGQNNYLWQPGLAAGVQDTLFGKPVQTDDFMPAIAANSLSIAFGDFKAAYRVVDRRGVKVLADPYTKKGGVYYFTTKRVGGAVRNFEAYKVMKFAAS